MDEAVGRFIPNGSSILMGACLEAAIPFAAGHELIRQGRRDLTLIGPISDMLFDQLIGAGCVSRVIAAWVGNVSAGLGHCFRRAVEDGVPRPLEVRDHSNFTLGLALLAASLGAPFIPTRSLLGSDLVRTNPDLVPAEDPLDGGPILLVRAVRPDVAVLHVQQADEHGRARLDGNDGVAIEGALAARTVVLTAEEVLPAGSLHVHPNRALVPAHKVTAVVEEPGGGHPAPVLGYTERDHEAFHDYHRRTRDVAGYQEWVQEWVFGVADRAAYRARLGER